MIKKAEEADPFRSLINPDSDPFLTVKGNMVEKIISFCKSTDQKVPETEGEIARCIFESLALKSALAIKSLMKVPRTKSKVLHLVGGGTRNELFCKMLASSIGAPVLAGPIEAAGVGNILIQAAAYDDIRNIEKGRRIVKKNMKIRKFKPKNKRKWKEIKEKKKKLLKYNFE